MSTNPHRRALNGATMGTRWSFIHETPEVDAGRLYEALSHAVTEVDAQMSTWKPMSDLMRLNRAHVGEWVRIPAALEHVLQQGIAIGSASQGVFNIAMGQATNAWGFGATTASPAAIRAALGASQPDPLELRKGEARRIADVQIDLNGIAKGYGVDRLIEAAQSLGIQNALAAIDGELRAIGTQSDGTAWSIAIEAPEYDRREPHSILALHDAAVATSGDYRHWVQVGDQKLSHTMDPRRGGPVIGAPASVTVVAQTCAAADAWATALMVAGVAEGTALATEHGLSALFLLRTENGVRPHGVGPLFT